MTIKIALKRAARRSELWTNARAACIDEITFRACIHTIERAVQNRLNEEYPT